MDAEVESAADLLIKVRGMLQVGNEYELHELTYEVSEYDEPLMQSETVGF